MINYVPAKDLEEKTVLGFALIRRLKNLNLVDAEVLENVMVYVLAED